MLQTITSTLCEQCGPAIGEPQAAPTTNSHFQFGSHMGGGTLHWQAAGNGGPLTVTFLPSSSSSSTPPPPVAPTLPSLPPIEDRSEAPSPPTPRALNSPTFANQPDTPSTQLYFRTLCILFFSPLPPGGPGKVRITIYFPKEAGGFGPIPARIRGKALSYFDFGPKRSWIYTPYGRL